MKMGIKVISLNIKRNCNEKERILYFFLSNLYLFSTDRMRVHNFNSIQTNQFFKT